MIINFSNTPPRNRYKQTPNFNGTSRFSQELQTYISNSVKSEEAEQKLIETFKNTLSQCITPENKIGSGKFGSVYRIDDEFVLKTPNNENIEADKVSFEDNPIIGQLKTYYGNIIAKFGNIKILKNAAATSSTLPAGVKEELLERSQKMNYYREVYLQRFSRLPQKAFDDIAADFKTLGKERKSFDTINPNNFIADGDSIRIVDDIQIPDDKMFNSLAGLVKVLLTSYDRNTKAEFDILAVGARRTILRKLILAGEKCKLDFGHTPAERKELNDALELCSIQTPWRDVQADLCEIRRLFPDETERLAKINQYIDDLEANDFNPFMD